MRKPVQNVLESIIQLFKNICQQENGLLEDSCPWAKSTRKTAGKSRQGKFQLQRFSKQRNIYLQDTFFFPIKLMKNAKQRLKIRLVQQGWKCSGMKGFNSVCLSHKKKGRCWGIFSSLFILSDIRMSHTLSMQITAMAGQHGQRGQSTLQVDIEATATLTWKVPKNSRLKKHLNKKQCKQNLKKSWGIWEFGSLPSWWHHMAFLRIF